MKIGFFGAAQMVTGSNYYIETEKGTRFLVDCGLFQGYSEEKLNRNTFPFEVSELDFVLLTHAHMDHAGRIPLLSKLGYRKKIHCTHATSDLSEIMLLDSARIQHQDAVNANRKRKRQGKELIEPLYDEDDVRQAIAQFQGYYYGELIHLTDDVTIRFRDAGHILGSSFIEVWVHETSGTHKIIFSGDLGMEDHLLMNAAEDSEGCETLLIESTYGNTVHKDYGQSLEKLMQVIEDVTSNGGTVVIPSFAVGRTQELIYEMNNYYEDRDIAQEKRIPIYVDSPLANRATSVFQENTDIMNDSAKKRIESGDNIFEFSNLHYVTDISESMRLNADKSPKVIISSSGMATAGRVRHHLKHNIWNPKNAVIFVGYQAQGTLGRLIRDGAPKIKLFGEWVEVRAQIYNMPGFSAHADAPTLISWIDKMEHKPNKVIIVHGEIDEMEPFSHKLQEKGYNTYIPRFGEILDLNKEKMERDSVVSLPELNLEEITAAYTEMKELIGKINGKNIDFNRIQPEKREYLFEKIHELKADLMDLNMALGK